MQTQIHIAQVKLNGTGTAAGTNLVVQVIENIAKSEKPKNQPILIIFPQLTLANADTIEPHLPHNPAEYNANKISPDTNSQQSKLTTASLKHIQQLLNKDKNKIEIGILIGSPQDISCAMFISENNIQEIHNTDLSSSNLSSSGLSIQNITFEFNKQKFAALIPNTFDYNPMQPNLITSEQIILEQTLAQAAQDRTLYQDITCFINISPSPFEININKAAQRHKWAKRIVEKTKKPLICVQNVGAIEEIIFDGGSFSINSSGQISISCPYFDPSINIIDSKQLIQVDKSQTPNQSINKITPTQTLEPMAQLFSALTQSCQQHFNSQNFKQACLHLSGELHSAVTLAIMASAIELEHIEAILTPSQYTNTIDVSCAKAQLSLIPVKHQSINTDPIIKEYNKALTKMQEAQEPINLKLKPKPKNPSNQASINQHIKSQISHHLLSIMSELRHVAIYSCYADSIDVYNTTNLTRNLDNPTLVKLAQWINTQRLLIPNATINTALAQR